MYICDLYTSPTQADRNMKILERAMLLVDILNTRAMTADDVEQAVQKLHQDLDDTKGPA